MFKTNQAKLVEVVKATLGSIELGSRKDGVWKATSGTLAQHGAKKMNYKKSFVFLYKLIQTFNLPLWFSFYSTKEKTLAIFSRFIYPPLIFIYKQLTSQNQEKSS
ncbi:hypothetical protein KIL84_014988 [Mauremys mutica]|uniref:Uncharacterized protein n=1 Tax=Mauremys mutica TaxID=74926 RepID=A0A9D3XQR4_9SAUR|nr:hypothetical protein KIL84_014988 [Mauremys mutica]